MRGRAGEEPLTATTLERLGQVLAAQLCTGSVLIGHDGRESGETLVAALAAGLSHGGIHVDILGLATTPADVSMWRILLSLYWISRRWCCGALVMRWASWWKAA